MQRVHKAAMPPSILLTDAVLGAAVPSIFLPTTLTAACP